MAGRIINGLKQAETCNPVFMLDEIDKLDSDYRGDPSAALLEVLDPEQNNNFEDHYLDMPFDLSKIIFIATANTLDIPPPLLDRMEVIRYSGYTTSEKKMIAQKYLLPKSMETNGLIKEQVTLGETILQTIIENYTKESGVRQLSRCLDKIMRKVAREILSKKSRKNGAILVDEKRLSDYLGPKKYDVSLQNKSNEVGVATGLAWTSVGGDVLFVEVSSFPGKGELKLTGQLGEVMKESAQAAMTFIRANTKELHIESKKLDKLDVHVHVPEGAVPKDGPSAGVTMVTALASALTGKKIRKDVAMTGEVTLRGKVLRIGGLKEKSIAAARAGCTTICIPFENKRDLVEIPDEIKKKIKFIPTKSVRENLKIALV
jgi:ATP-dependent Lon protease